MLGAAVVDDILALILLSVAVGMAADGGVDAGKIALALAVAVAFVAFVALGGTQLLQRRPQLLEAPRFADSPLLPAVILCLGLAAFSAQIGLAALIGAFLAGMIVAETKDQSSIEEEVQPLYAFFPPFFFAFIGIELSLDSLFSAHALLLLAAITALAVVTKLIPGYLGGAVASAASEAAIVGVGMVPRGEVGIVVASIGAAEGVVDAELFAVVVAMSILTTLIAPFALRRISRDVDLVGCRARPEQAALDQQLGDLHGVGGGALAQVVGDDPEVEGALVAGVAADAADEDVVACRRRRSPSGSAPAAGSSTTVTPGAAASSSRARSG